MSRAIIQKDMAFLEEWMADTSAYLFLYGLTSSILPEDATVDDFMSTYAELKEEFVGSRELTHVIV